MRHVHFESFPEFKSSIISYKSEAAVKGKALQIINKLGHLVFVNEQECCQSLAEQLIVPYQEIKEAISQITSKPELDSLGVLKRKIIDFITEKRDTIPFEKKPLKPRSYPKEVRDIVFPDIKECQKLEMSSVREFYNLNNLYVFFKTQLIDTLKRSPKIEQKAAKIVEESCLEIEEVKNSFEYYLQSKSDFITRELIALLDSFETSGLKDVWESFKQQSNDDIEQAEAFFFSYLCAKLICRYRENNKKIDLYSFAEVQAYDFGNGLDYLYEESNFNFRFWNTPISFHYVAQKEGKESLSVTRYEIPVEDFYLFDTAINDMFINEKLFDFLCLCLRGILDEIEVEK